MKISRTFALIKRLGTTEEIVLKGPIIRCCSICLEPMDNDQLEMCYSCSDDIDMALDEDHT